MNPFATYRYINAEEIVKANIRPNHIEADATSLLNTLQPVTFLANLDSQKAQSLHRNVIQKLNAKPHTLDLLQSLGYELNPTGEYGYQQTSYPEVIEAQENASREFQKFYEDLKKIKTHSLNGFEEYIKSTSERPLSRNASHDRQSSNRHRHHSSSTSTQQRHRSPSITRLPDYETVKDNNEKTNDIVKSLKKSIIPRHEGPVAHSFIRRKLLLLLFKQIYPDSNNFGDIEIENEIDRKIRTLRERDQHRTSSNTDEVYFECLIRTNFDLKNATEMLQTNRPDLIHPPEPERPAEPTTTTIANCLGSMQNQWALLTQNAEEDRGEQVLVHAGDEWKNTMHVVTAIRQFREQFQDPSNAMLRMDRIYRLIFNELSLIIGPQSSLKIEILANVLCALPYEIFEHLNMIDVRDIILSCDDQAIPENFEQRVRKALSKDCVICGGSYPNSYMQEMYLCSHTCCLDCAKGYYRSVVSEISDVKSLNRLTCFQEAHEITEDVKLNFFNYLGAKMNQWFTDERRILDLYHENLYMATKDSKDKKCGNPRCTAFFNNDNNQIARIQCPHCNFQQCQQCGRKWNDEHKSKTCENYADWLKDNDPDDPEVQLNKYLNTAGMVCPNARCQAVYEYQPGGCEHFRCPTCNTEFCRICSALFYNPAHNTICPQTNCSLKKTVHAHCCLNCFREIRDADNDEIVQLLTTHGINVTEELRQKPQATGPQCPVEGCKRAAAATFENRFCDVCYKQFICLLVWRNEIEPWQLYTDNNLRQKLTNASVNVPANATKANLIALAKQHLTQFLGKPKKISRKG